MLAPVLIDTLEEILGNFNRRFILDCKCFHWFTLRNKIIRLKNKRKISNIQVLSTKAKNLRATLHTKAPIQSICLAQYTNPGLIVLLKSWLVQRTSV